MTRTYGSSIAHATAMLRALRSEHLGISDLARMCGLDKGNASRLLAEMARAGLVERSEAGPRYGLGLVLVELGMAALRQFDLRERALPTLERLARETGETVHLAVPSGVEVVYLAKVESPGAIQMRSKVGDSMPIQSTGLGKALMPVLAKQTQERVLSAPIVARTPNTVLDPVSVREEMTATLRRGYAVDWEENEEGVRCVAAPVFNHDGQVAGAISIAGPAFRMDRKRIEWLGQVVQESAASISRRMGHQPPERVEPLSAEPATNRVGTTKTMGGEQA